MCSPSLGSQEVYGFVGWIVTFIAYFAYLAWAFVPEAWLEAIGITYYPDKYWAIAVPAWLLAAIFFTLLIYAFGSMAMNPPLDSRQTFTDSYALEPAPWGSDAGVPMEERHKRCPPIFDIPLSEVNRVLYHGAAAKAAVELRLSKAAAAAASEGVAEEQGAEGKRHSFESRIAPPNLTPEPEATPAQRRSASAGRLKG